MSNTLQSKLSTGLIQARRISYLVCFGKFSKILLLSGVKETTEKNARKDGAL